MDIKPCKVRIDQEHALRYSAMLKVTQRKRSRSRQSNDAIDRSISSHNNVTASTLDTTRWSMTSSISSKRSRHSTGSTTISNNNTANEISSPGM